MAGLLDLIAANAAPGSLLSFLGASPAAPAPSPFDTGTAPISYLGSAGANPLGMPANVPGPMGGLPNAFPPQPAMAAPSAISAPPVPAGLPVPQLQPPAQDIPPDASPIAVGNTMMPRIGPASLYASANLPPNAAPTQGALPGGPLPQMAAQAGLPAPSFPGASGQPGFMTGYENLKHGGGLIGSLIAGITGQRNDATGIQQQNLGAQFQALRQTYQQQGLAPQAAASRAMLTLMNPAAAKATLPNMQVLKDSFGNQVPYWSNPNNQTFQPALGGTGGASASSDQILNDIAQARAHGANQQQLLQQIPAAYRGYVGSLLAGNAIPVNIGRSQLRGPIMMLAHAVDPTFNENMIPQRIAMTQDIGRSSPGSIGGILSNGKSAFEHLATLSDAAVNLGNDNGPAIPGGALIGWAENAIGNSTPANSAKVSALNDAAQKYGQESTKFYAGTGGGEAERAAALNTIGDHTSSLNQAAFLQTERSLMMARLTQKRDQIEAVMGPAYIAAHPVITPELKATLAHIDANIAKLRGEGTPATSGSPAPARGSLQPGQSTVINGVTIKRVN